MRIEKIEKLIKIFLFLALGTLATQILIFIHEAVTFNSFRFLWITIPGVFLVGSSYYIYKTSHLNDLKDSWKEASDRKTTPGLESKTRNLYMISFLLISHLLISFISIFLKLSGST